MAVVVLLSRQNSCIVLIMRRLTRSQNRLIVMTGNDIESKYGEDNEKVICVIRDKTSRINLSIKS